MRRTGAEAVAALLLLVAALASGGVAAQASPVLRYDPPPGFYRSAITPPEDYASNEFNASVQIYPFRPFNGDIEQAFRQSLLRDWIDRRYREANVAAAPEFRVVSVQGAQLAMTARFMESVAGMPRQHMRLLLVSGTSAAIVDASAGDITTWQRALPALNAMSATLRVEAAAPLPSVTAGPGAAGAAVAGIYMGTKPKYMPDLDKPVGYGRHVAALHFYVFSADGRVYRAYDSVNVPGGDVRRFDFAAAQSGDPGNSGRYTVKDGRLVMRMGGQPPETIVSAAPQDGRVTIDAVIYLRQ